MAEFGPYGAAVNCIAPGPTLTPFTEKNLGLGNPEKREGVGSTILTGRVWEPADVAAAALFLAGEESGYVQGVTLNVGGWLGASWPETT